MRNFFAAIGLVALATVLMAQTAPFRYTEQPVVAVPNFDNVVCLGEPSLTHYWKLADLTAAGSGATPGPAATNLAADSVSACATAAPSPVGLIISTPAASPWPIAGAVGMVKDGTTAFDFTNGIGSLQGQFMNPASTGIMSNLCNANAGGACTLPFWVECIVTPAQMSGTTTFYFDADGTASGLGLGMNGTTGPVFILNSTAETTFAKATNGVPYDLLYTFNPTGVVSDFYVNGTLAIEITTSPGPVVGANSVTYIGSKTGAAAGWGGRIEKCATGNIYATPQMARAHFLSTGFY